jgi:hypothetical protein
VSVFPPDISAFNREPVRRPGSRSPRYGLHRSSGASLQRVLTDAPAAKARAREWKRAHGRRVLIVDLVVILVTATIAQSGVISFWSTDAVTDRGSWLREAAFFAILVILWLTALQIQKSRDISLVGIGAEEYRRVVTATMWAFGLFAVTLLLLGANIPRRHLGVALVLGLLGLVIGRHGVRKALARRRKRGEFSTRVVVLGKPDSVRVLCQSFGRTTGAGYEVVGVCIPGFDGEVGEELVTATGTVPILGSDGDVEKALSLTSADTLAVAAVEHLGPEKTKKLLWRLESLDTDLIMMPGVTDIAGPRFLMRPIDDLPLFHIAPPRQDGPSSIAKRWFDLSFGVAALLAVLPVMALAAFAIELDDGGPVMFRQERVGRGGKLFRIFKFRTMTVDAEARNDSE